MISSGQNVPFRPRKIPVSILDAYADVIYCLSISSEMLTGILFLKTLAGENSGEFSYLDYLEEKTLANGLQIKHRY